jgi:hypothetical protein
MTDIKSQTQTDRSVYATKDKLLEYTDAKFVLTLVHPIRQKSVYNYDNTSVKDFLRSISSPSDRNTMFTKMTSKRKLNSKEFPDLIFLKSVTSTK